MRTGTGPFNTADEASVQQPVITVTLAPNREQVALTQVGGSIGAQNQEFTAHITPAGTLLRIWQTDAGSGNRNIIQNRVLPIGDPSNAQLTTTTTVLSTARPVTRPALASSSGLVRLFYIKNSDTKIYYRDSANDGVSYGSETLLPSTITATWPITALAAVSPTLLFACRRVSATISGVYYYWIELTAFENTAGGWQEVKHPQPTQRLRALNNSALIDQYWDSVFQFDATWADEANAKACVMFLDDLAGRPATTIYQRRWWSDMTSVEAIDFAEPERDDLVGLRMGTVGDLLIMHGRRTLADTDFTYTQAGVLYTSPDGIAWSDAYLGLDTLAFNWGKPLYWQDQVWLVGAASLYKLRSTILWGTAAAEVFDCTELVLNASVEETSEDCAPAQSKITLENPNGILTSHPSFVEGSTLTVSAGFATTEQVTLFVGNINTPTTAMNRDESRIELSANDATINLKQGTSDRTIVVDQPNRNYWKWNTPNELEQWAMTENASWGWNSSSGNGYVEAIKAGINRLVVGTGLINRISIRATMQIVNPAVGVTTGGANAGNAEAGILFGMNDTATSYYVLKFGYNVTRFELWKNDAGVSTKLATSSALLNDVPINKYFDLYVTQFNQTITIGYFDSATSAIQELIRYTEQVPLNAGGICGIRATLPADKPTSGTYVTVTCDMFLYASHAVERTAEEYLRLLAVSRGIRDLQGGAALEKVWSSLGTDWVYTDTPNFVTYSGGHLEWSGLVADNTSILHDAFMAQDIVVDLDMQIGNTNVLASGAFGRAGVAVRWDQTYETGVLMFVSQSNFGGTVNQAYLQVLVYELVGGIKTLTKNRTIPLLIPSYVGERTTYRFVVTGPWYALYINDMHAGTIFDDTWVRDGAFGVYLHDGSGKLYSLRVPAFGLGLFPLIMPNESFDSAFVSVLSTYHGWSRMNGTTMVIGNDLDDTSVATLDDSLIYNAQRGNSTQPLFSHCRVISKLPDNTEITGATNSPDLWRQLGRQVTKIETVDGLRTEQECRDRAWQFLVDQQRFMQERPYPTPQRLRWEKRDVFQGTVQRDDTDRLLTLMAIARRWQRKHQGAVWQTSQDVVFQDRHGVDLTRATEYPPL